MIRLLLEDVTPVRGEKITLHIRFKGGATKTLMVPALRPQLACLPVPLRIGLLLGMRKGRANKSQALSACDPLLASR
jgi:hypothetical protein